jgi:hypothetical protein
VLILFFSFVSVESIFSLRILSSCTTLIIRTTSKSAPVDREKTEGIPREHRRNTERIPWKDRGNTVGIPGKKGGNRSREPREALLFQGVTYPKGGFGLKYHLINLYVSGIMQMKGGG